MELLKVLSRVGWPVLAWLGIRPLELVFGVYLLRGTPAFFSCLFFLFQGGEFGVWHIESKSHWKWFMVG